MTFYHRIACITHFMCGSTLCLILENTKAPMEVVINVEIVIVTKLNQNGTSRTINNIRPTKMPQSTLYWITFIQTFLMK